MRISRSAATRIWSFKSTGEDSQQTILAQMPAETDHTQPRLRSRRILQNSIREEHFWGICQHVKNDLEEAVTAYNKGTERSTKEPFSFSQLGLDII